MPAWVRGFVVTDVAQVHLAFKDLLLLAERAEKTSRRLNTGASRALAAEARLRLLRYRSLYENFNRELQATAQQAAVQATTDIRDRLAATAVRPDTDATPHLRDLIVCQPLNVGAIATGAVGIADVGMLERAINPRSPSYGPYWRAQEYGTGQGEVPSQVGRVIYGYFMAAGGGDATPPQAQYAGGGGPHPVFQSAGRQRNFGLAGGFAGGVGAGPAGGYGGLGTIGVEIQPRYFIRDGANAASAAWRDRIARIQQQAIQGLAATTV